MTTLAESHPTRIDAPHMRQVLSHFCTGVTIVTAMGAEEPVGFTCQSFSSLSLDPPYVCFCPGKTSTTWPRIRDVGRFCVNVLAADQEELCRGFAVSGADKFAGRNWSLSPNGSPLLGSSLAWIDCTLEQEVDAGDHTIAIARVTQLEVVRDTAPLLFYRARFGRLAAETD
ncbi:flavin reductase family protein [Streptomyces sp. NPDC005373]|uniref:flavin reductase family protein n=1 Tax=unclassified Streptomyces TaxID=2593676 RepID=UPI0033A6F802